MSGAGKSALGRQLADAYDVGPHIDLDRFLIEKQGKFFSALRLDDIKAEIAAAPRPAIVVGICMLHVLNAIGLQPDVLIYVKRMRQWGWADRDVVEGESLPDDAPATEREVQAYHLAYHPEQQATFVLERVDNR